MAILRQHWDPLPWLLRIMDIRMRVPPFYFLSLARISDLFFHGLQLVNYVVEPRISV